jgi:hypothetical protein
MRRVEELLEGVIVTAIALGRRQIEEGDNAKRGNLDDAAASLRDAIKFAIDEEVASRVVANQAWDRVGPGGRRERIATAALAGMLGSAARGEKDNKVLAAVEFADLLIAELDK